jgi:hypothetical protein
MLSITPRYARLKPSELLDLRSTSSQMSSWLIILTGLIYAYIALEQAFKGNMGLACMYAGYCFANYGAYLIATK